MDLPRGRRTVVPTAFAAPDRPRERFVPDSRQTEQPLGGALRRDQRTCSNANKAKRRIEEVNSDSHPAQIAPGDAEMDESGVPCHTKPISSAVFSSENHDQCDDIPHPARDRDSASLVVTETFGMKPVEGAAVGRREKKRSKPHRRESDDDVRIVPPTAPVKLKRNHSRDRTKGHSLTGDDEAIAMILQVEEEEGVARKASTRHTPPSSSSTSAQDDLVSQDYLMALRLQESFDKEAASGHQTRDVYFGSRVGAKRMRDPSMLQRAGNFQCLRDIGRPMVEDPEDGMSYEALLELEDIPVGMSRQAIGSHSTTYVYDEAGAGTSTQQMCSICIEPFTHGQELRALPCLHSFHCKCVDRWLSQSKQCPVCFKNIQELH